jgi:hypothetical protein
MFWTLVAPPLLFLEKFESAAVVNNDFHGPHNGALSPFSLSPMYRVGLSMGKYAAN